MYAFYTIIAIKTFGIVLEKHLDLLILHHTLLHNLRSTQEWFSHDEINLLCQTCQIGSFFASSITTTYYSHHFLTIEKAIASGACTHTHACIFLLIFQSQITSCRSCSDNQSIGLYEFLIIDGDLKRTGTEVCLRSHTVANICTEVDCLLTHVLHQLVGIYALWMTREVLYNRSCGKLSAWLQS